MAYWCVSLFLFILTKKVGTNEKKINRTIIHECFVFNLLTCIFQMLLLNINGAKRSQSSFIFRTAGQQKYRKHIKCRRLELCKVWGIYSQWEFKLTVNSQFINEWTDDFAKHRWNNLTNRCHINIEFWNWREKI